MLGDPRMKCRSVAYCTEGTEPEEELRNTCHSYTA